MGLQKCGLNLNRIGKELQAHGTIEFPCAGYSSFYTDTPEDIIPWHWHEEIEIVYVKTGAMMIRTQGKKFHLKEGDCIVINSNILHYAIAEPVCDLQSLVFSPLLITGTKDSAFAVKYITPITKCCFFDGWLLKSSDDAIRKLINNFIHAFEALSLNAFGYEFIVRERLTKICIALYQNFKQEISVGVTEPDQDSFRIRRMLDFIHKNYIDELSLQEIAMSADIGDRECMRCFQRTIQISPMQYLLKYRIMRGASILMENPIKNISDVSMACGFDSPSNFSKMFKRYYSCTPREYRNNKNG